MELQQQVHTQDIKLSRGARTKLDSDRVKRMQEILSSSASPEEALIKRCSQFLLEPPNQTAAGYSMGPFEIIISERRSQYDDLREELKRNLRQAEWLRRQISGARQPADTAAKISVCRFGIWKRDFAKEDYDPEGTGELLCLIKAAEDDYHIDHEHEFYRDPPNKEQIAIEKAQQKQHLDLQKKMKQDAIQLAKQTKKNEAKVAKEAAARWAKQCKSGMVKGCQSTTNRQAPNTEAKKGKQPSIQKAEELLPFFGPLDYRTARIGSNNTQALEQSLRTLAGHLRGLGTELLSRIRALRFLSHTRELQQWQSLNKKDPKCQGCGSSVSSPSEIFVLGVCGHLACHECLESRREEKEGFCILEGCSSVAGPQHLHAGSDFGAEEQRAGSYGKKLDELIKLIKEIPPADQVLLFVQFNDLLLKVESALEESGISYYAIGNNVNDVRNMSDFQENTSETKRKVLLLNPASESASGV